jgi:hypothetical protein
MHGETGIGRGEVVENCSFAASRLARSSSLPTAGAVGFILSPLCGLGSGALTERYFIPRLTGFMA